MKNKIKPELNDSILCGMMEAMTMAASVHAKNASILFQYSATPIKSDEEVLLRADVMDRLMDIATKETDMAIIFANAISDRIEEYESEHADEIKIPAAQMLKGMMEIKNLKQGDLTDIATQSVISEILSGKRKINLKQAKGFSEYFNLPINTFID